jgi:hypothetical protein
MQSSSVDVSSCDVVDDVVLVGVGLDGKYVGTSCFPILTRS